MHNAQIAVEHPHELSIDELESVSGGDNPKLKAEAKYDTKTESATITVGIEWSF
jgi:bacteriocin-like protein